MTWPLAASKATACLLLAAFLLALLAPPAHADRSEYDLEHSGGIALAPDSNLADGSSGQAKRHEFTQYWAKARSWAQSQSWLQVRSWAQAQSSTESQVVGLVLGFGKTLAKCACLVIFIAILAKVLGKVDCNSKKCDCRKWCKPIARFLMYIGYDEFEEFDAICTVHSVQDVKKDGLLGELEFKVKVRFNWSNFETALTKDLRWEQTKGLPIPQGTSECKITLLSAGKLSTKTVASYSMEVKKDMLDRPGFWGEKQKFKMEDKGKVVGTLLMTFRKPSEGEGGDFSGMVPITGIDDDSSLAVELMKEMEELEKTPGFVKPQGKLEGDQKLELLARVLEGDLREMDKKGKVAGVVYVKVYHCNYAELQGDDRKDELKRQMEKAKKKGLQQIEKKWYWCWYEDKKAATKKWNYPDGFINMTSITSVHRAPERIDEFVIKYSEGGDKEQLVYRREKGKGLDLWIEGLDVSTQEIRKQLKDTKESAEQNEQAYPRMKAMHQSWVQSKGMPQTAEDWQAWYGWFRDNNYPEDLIKKLYSEIASQQPKAKAQPPGKGAAAAPAKGKGAAKGGGGAAPKAAAPKAKSQSPQPKRQR